VLVVNPQMDTSGLSVFDWLPTVAYPPLDIVALVVLLQMGRSNARILASWWLLLGAFTLMLTADTLYAVLAMPDAGGRDESVAREERDCHCELAAAVPAILLAGWPDLVLETPLVTAVVGLVLVTGASTRALLVLRHQRDAERVLEVQATRDPLTGLANRAVLIDQLSRQGCAAGGGAASAR